MASHKLYSLSHPQIEAFLTIQNLSPLYILLYLATRFPALDCIKTNLTLDKLYYADARPQGP